MINTIEHDVQAETEGFPKIPIGKVGIRNIELPVWIKNHDGEMVSTIANISSYCDLVEENKGINMSRILRNMLDIFTPSNKRVIMDLSEEVVKKLQFAHETSDVYLKVRFKYPYFKRSPMTNITSPEVLNVTIETVLKNTQIKKYITVEMVGMSLCPCSKDMSLLVNNLSDREKDALENADLPFSLYEKIQQAGFGAHNQKSFVKVTVELKDNYFDLEKLIPVINKGVSTQTFSVLKRPDEKYVTEMSYMGGYIDENKMLHFEDPNDGPKFVEDISRQIAEELNNKYLDKEINDYVIVVRNEESIHSQGMEAVSILTAGRDLK